MKTLNQNWTKPFPLNKPAVVLFLVLSILGFLDAAYLTVSHYRNALVPCPVTGQCETVLTSKYATVGPIPLALIGAFYYLTLLILTVVYLETENAKALRLAARLTWAGFLVSLGLVWLQLFVIHAICIYCLVSATASTLIFILGLVIRKRLLFS